MRHDFFPLQAMKEREWQAYRRRKRLRLKRPGFTILSTNCIAGVMYHDLGLEFLTPTINLTIPIRDFISLAENLRWYMDQPLIELDNPGGCPAALLPGGVSGDVRVNFLHYASFEEGAVKWEERKRRINWDRIVLIATDRGECDYELLRRFDRLPYHKAIFTHRSYPEFSSAYYIKGFEEQEEVGILTDFKPGRLKRRYMDDFDYVSFLNALK